MSILAYIVTMYAELVTLWSISCIEHCHYRWRWSLVLFQNQKRPQYFANYLSIPLHEEDNNSQKLEYMWTWQERYFVMPVTVQGPSTNLFSAIFFSKKSSWQTRVQLSPELEGLLQTLGKVTLSSFLQTHSFGNNVSIGIRSFTMWKQKISVTKC